MKDLYQLRKDYEGKPLLLENTPENPGKLFTEWFDEALSNEPEPNAMVLATVGKSHLPDARTVLLKEFSEEEMIFTFFSNYKSKKASDIENTPHAALVFYWHNASRQVRVRGLVEKSSREDAREYFLSRPPQSRLSAWISHQSQIIPSREHLEKEKHIWQDTFSEEQLNYLPPFWGGYIIFATEIEFWQGRSGRLHDRILYRKYDDIWQKNRLAP